MTYTPRLLTQLWDVLARCSRLSADAAATDGAAFLAHYAAHGGTPPAFTWDAPGARFLYDPGINQVQGTPPEAVDAAALAWANKTLWELLPPHLFEASGADWTPLWTQALWLKRVPEIQFLLEQGVDVNRPLPDGAYPPAYVVVPFGGSLEALRVLVEAGADLTRPGTDPETLIAECHRGVSSAGENQTANEIEAYLRAWAPVARPGGAR